MRRLLLIFSVLLLAGCSGADSGLSLGEVEVLSAEGEQYPSQMLLRVSLTNRGGAFTLRQGRLRVGIQGRRQAVFTLCDKVKVGRGRQSVLLGVKCSVVHNSLSEKLLRCVEQQQWSSVEADGSFKVRRGIFSRRIELPTTSLEELLTASQREQLWQLLYGDLANK